MDRSFTVRATARHLPGLELRDPHPLAGREAWQCDECQGIWYPDLNDPYAGCPYCSEDDDE